MKLLIVTQKVDLRDPILGFFHRWVEEFAKHCEEVTVIAQWVKDHNLPLHVHVYSLGKEKGRSRLLQVCRYRWLLWSLRRDYDAVFVHMTPIWVVLGTFSWLILHKSVYLWYEIKRGSWVLSLALFLVRKVFAATPSGLPAPNAKLAVTGHGIDTELFRPGTEPRHRGMLLTIGRLTAIKNLDLLIRALRDLPSECTLTIIGGTITEEDQRTRVRLEALAQSESFRGRVHFVPFVSHPEIVPFLQHAALFVHAAQGGIDKVVLEAMACGCPVVSSSIAARHVLPEVCQAEHSAPGIAHAVRRILECSPEERADLQQRLRARVVQEHNLSHCIARIVQEMG
jgi:glycosyltransferase involved in cell wall biosynthesis